MPASTSLNNQKGIAHFLVLALVVVGIGVGIYLVQNPTFFKPHASEPTQTPAQQLASGLISYWKLDETSGTTAIDSKGLNNGTFINTRPVDGKFGKARNFATNWDYIDLGRKASLGNVNSMTVSAWVNTTRTGVQYILHHPVPFGMGGWTLRTDELSKPRMGIFDGANSFLCLANTRLTPNSWYLVTGSYDRTNLKIYVNGVLENTCPQTAFVQVNDANTFVAFDNGDGSSGLKGSLDELGIWNRALSAFEVQELAGGMIPDVGSGGGSGSNQTATITANPNPCNLNGATSCHSTISWSSSNASDLKITIRENPGSVLAQSVSGSVDVPWISASGATFDAYSGSTRLASLFVQGTGPTSTPTPTPTPTTSPTASPSPSAPAHILSAGPNPCLLNGSTVCSSRIVWSSNFNDLKITIRENPGSVFATGASGSASAPWISASGATFEAYSGGVLKDSLFVKGVTSSASTGILSASPNPCTIAAGQETCTSTISWISNYPDLKIRIKENPGSLFAAGPSGSSTAPWIRTSGATFEAYSEGIVVDSLFVKGVN